MKILFTHRYFWPDTPPYGLLLRELAVAVSKQGHQVNVYTSVPSYSQKADGSSASREEVYEGISIKRGFVFNENSNSVIRALNILVYSFGLFVHIIRIRPDVVTAATFPPVIAGFVASMASKLIGAKFVYHLQDIHPEVSKYSGASLVGRWLIPLFVFLDNRTLGRADAVIVLSEDMADTLRDRKCELPHIHVINNPPVADDIVRNLEADELKKRAGCIRLIFAGNLGRFQNLPLLVEGISRCFVDYPNLELLLLGDGSSKKELQSKWNDHHQVIFIPFMPFSKARLLIEGSDVGLVSLQENIYRVSFPSKLTTYLSMELPLLVLVEPESEMAKIVEHNQLGRVPKKMTAGSIEEALRGTLESLPIKVKSSAWFENNCTAAANQAAWLTVLASVNDANSTKR